MERISITINYNLREDEFSALSEKYPTGEYFNNDKSILKEESERVKWFRVKIHSSTGVLVLTWFSE